MRFLQPEMARWLLAIPIVCCFWFITYRYRRHIRRPFAIQRRFKDLSRISNWKRDTALLGLSFLALVSLVLAMMRPQIYLNRQTPIFERQDLILVLDRSASMRARDIRPSRFGRAVMEIKNFLKQKPEAIDRVGLVGFSGTSVVLSFLTRDVSNLFFYLDWIEEDPDTLFGTDIGAALNSALEVARKDNSTSKKIFMVLSDGEDHGAQLSKTIASLSQEGARVHCIGIGSEEDVYIPVSGSGGEESFLQDESGKMLSTRFDESTLRGIANVTGGRYFRSLTGNELAAAMNEVVKHEQKILGWKTTGEYRDVYWLGLLSAGIASVCMLIVL